MADIKGTCTYVNVGIDIPKTDIGAGVTWAFSADCDIIGMGFDVSLGFGGGEDEWNPFEVEGGLCNVPEVTFSLLFFC